MLIREQPPLHLTYCLNVHPGERWEENLHAIRTHALAVKSLVSPSAPFGLGLRLSRQAADTLHADPQAVASFRQFLADHDLYAFTINGFPYGTFHGKPVKTDVYRPDWGQPERLEYTQRLADILAVLLPEGTDGSISTVPLAYGRPPREDGEYRVFCENLARCAAHLHALRLNTGREIHLGLEPEPDCLLECVEDVLAFFDGPLARYGTDTLAQCLRCPSAEARAILRRHVGVCLDTCHLAVRFADPAEGIARLEQSGIRISKVQLSAAIEAEPSDSGRERLREFCDAVYMHQVTVRAEADGVLRTVPDLDRALHACGSDGTWRVHCHVPLYFAGDGDIRSTARQLTPAFWRALVRAPVSHLEIETYTFNVLPAALRCAGVERTIAGEFEWALARLRPALR